MNINDNYNAHDTVRQAYNNRSTFIDRNERFTVGGQFGFCCILDALGLATIFGLEGATDAAVATGVAEGVTDVVVGDTVTTAAVDTAVEEGTAQVVGDGVVDVAGEDAGAEAGAEADAEADAEAEERAEQESECEGLCTAMNSARGDLVTTCYGPGGFPPPASATPGDYPMGSVPRCAALYSASMSADEAYRSTCTPPVMTPVITLL